jgi:hypothetical protein
MIEAETVAIPPTFTGVLIVPSWDEGHAEFAWDKKNEIDTAAARKHFVELKAKGYMCYRVDPKSGDKGEVVKEFDPTAEKLIMVPPIIGG